MKSEDTVMSDERIGDLLDLETESTYPCSDGSKTTTIDCHKVVEAQADISFRAGEREMFRKLRQALRGEPVVFDFALDGVEIQWLYEQVRRTLFKG